MTVRELRDVLNQRELDDHLDDLIRIETPLDHQSFRLSLIKDFNVKNVKIETKTVVLEASE